MINDVIDVRGSKVFIENDEVKTVFNEEIQRTGYMPLEEMRKLLHAKFALLEKLSKRKGSFK